MNRSIKLSKALALPLLAAFVWAGCADLSVDNLNAPDEARALSSPGDLVQVLNGGYASWWDGTYQGCCDGRSPGPHLDGWGDAQTTTNAFAGFWDTTNEPRIRFNNTTSYGDLNIAYVPWRNLLAATHAANEVINQVENNGLEIVIDATGENRTQATLAEAYFLRGVALGYLANMFDQAYIPEPGQLERPAFSAYPEVLDAALAALDQSIQLSTSNTFQVGDVLPFSEAYASDQFARLGRSFAARFMVSNPRTAQENQNVDWARVRDYAANGIQSDFVLTMNGDNWYNYYQSVSGLHWYWRVDNRLLDLMAQQGGTDNYPKKYPADLAGTALAPIQYAPEAEAGATYTTGDRRIQLDFTYNDNQSFFRIARGPELQSTYFWSRLLYMWDDFLVGDSPIMRATENEMMLAEAELWLGNAAAAVEIVNNSTRTTRGELPPLSASAAPQEIANAIFYERNIECYRTGIGLPYFDLRRRDALQAGTPLHLPVPADELETVGEPTYTFGGVSFASEPGTADGSNSWTNEGNNPPAVPGL